MIISRTLKRIEETNYYTFVIFIIINIIINYLTCKYMILSLKIDKMNPVINVKTTLFQQYIKQQ